MEEQYHSEDESLVQDAQNPQKKDQRVLVGLFVFLFAGISIVGLQGITRSIQHPFTRKDGSTATTSLAQLSTDQQKNQTDEALKKLDTDRDGLSDYDEISIYGTSAFLDDSDGDEYDDKTEILTGHDPLCNDKTENCGASRGELSSTSASTSTENIPKLSGGLLDASGKPTGELSFGSSENTGNTGTLPAITIPGFDRPMTIDELRNLSPEEIRAFLIRQGGSEKDIKNIDDATLKRVYERGFTSAFEKVAKEQEMQGSPTASLPPVSSLVPPASSTEAEADPLNPQTMTSDQLRDLLRKSGKISEEDLKKIDDATLKAFAEQTYQEIKGSK